MTPPEKRNKEKMVHTYEREWHLDKRVNISVIAAVVLYGIIFGTMYGSLSTEVTNLKQTINHMNDVIPRVVRIEENTKHMKEDIQEMNQGIKDLSVQLREKN